jgi:hypothetical protein
MRTPRSLGLDVAQALTSVVQLGIVLPAVPEELFEKPLKLRVHLARATGLRGAANRRFA